MGSFSKYVITILALFLTNTLLSQDLVMQDGTFIRCAPDRFFDSGGISNQYNSNENLTITICPPNADEVVILDFLMFNTEDNVDIMTIYNGGGIASPLIGNYSGNISPGRIVSTDSSGCLTIQFLSNDSGNALGWEANITCAPQCQTISPTIDSTTPSIDTISNQIEIIPGQTVNFNGSAIFSDTDANASYLWDFGTGATASSPSASHQFIDPGTYNVTFTVSDDNPLICSETVSIRVLVRNSIVTINNAVFAQSFFSPEELIENVLVTGGCSAVDNFETQVFGAATDIETKSYGYFSGRGMNGFPFEEGIVLTSGTAFLGGNESLPVVPAVSGTNGLSGDADLETELGITNTQDATFIKFNFTPTTNNISFRYIMASEEYNQNDECNFADGFAFLLRRIGEVDYENLAILPDGTPVNVTNINGISCPGSPTNNPEFFDAYNLGATNYGGRTEVLTATANVIPNETYEIKLVVADQGDSLFDTAIFIEAGSFNLGGDLGDDITIAAGNAECGGQQIILDTRAPNAGHTWFFNGSEILGEEESILVVEEAGVYSVDVEFAVGCSTSDSILIEFRNSPEIISPAIDLSECSATGMASFNLELNTPIVFGSQDINEFEVSYHTSQVDADTGNNPIPATEINTYNGTDGEIIFIRINDISSQTCVVTDNFVLSVFESVTSENVLFQLCDNDIDGSDTNGIVEFNLQSINDEVLGTQDPSQFSVSYHINLTDAIAGNGPLPSLYENTTPNLQTIFARVQNNSNIDCFETSTITLQVNALPVITTSVDLRQCDDDTDGISNFNLTEANDLISSNAVNETFTYYTSLADATDGTNFITNELSYPNTDASANPDVLFVRVENANTCFRIAQLNLFVSTSAIPAGFVIPPFEECDDTRVDDNITDGVTVFDFSSATPLIEAIFPVGQSITVTYYESLADALSEINAIPDITNHINLASPFNQTITYRVDNDSDNSCQGLGEFQLRTINPMPRTDTESIDLITCDDITIGNLSEEFDLTQNEAFIFDGNPNLSASYFLDFNDALNNVTTNEITTPTAYININPNETIYVRVLDVTTNCFTVVDFDITVNPLPSVITVTPLEECENGTDGVFDFDLGEKRSEILNGQDSAQFNVTFHRNQADADNLTGFIGDMFTNTINPQEIFYAITNTTTGCSNSTGSFFIEVLEGAQFNSDGEPLDFELCDDNIENDGVAQFDLRLIEDEILDGQDTADYTITYHFSQQNALDNEEPLPFLYENLTNPQTIWVRVSNNISPEICFEIGQIPLRVNPLPEFDLDDLYVLCVNPNGSEVVPVPPILDTGLSAIDFNFEWSLDGNILPLENAPSLTPTQGGIYSVVVTDITSSQLTRCTSMDEAIVLESEVPEVIAEVTSQAFAGNHIIEATTSNVGDFEFSLDNGPYQDNGIFENVKPGLHTVFARDINGCGIGSDIVLVIDYPLFFTPNGDGNNETWNIVGIDTQPSAKIYIFDRYGKLLKQLSPTSQGWDGTYRGSIMPTDDYWFTVEYIEPTTGESKVQTAHFTLKR